MKRIFAVIIAIIFILTAVPKKAQCRENEDIYRLHIIANSDSQSDQSVKYLVRDNVLAFEKKIFAKYDDMTKDLAKELLMDNAGKIYEIAKNTLAQNGKEYDVMLSTGIYDFPDRTYGDKFYPAGKYDALRIVLGEGKGKNWWCVMFPPLCIIDGENEQIENTGDKTTFDSLFVDLCKWIKGLFEK